MLEAELTGVASAAKGKAGRRPTCWCNECRLCKSRAANRRYYYRRKLKEAQERELAALRSPAAPATPAVQNDAPAAQQAAQNNSLERAAKSD